MLMISQLPHVYFHKAKDCHSRPINGTAPRSHICSDSHTPHKYCFVDVRHMARAIILWHQEYIGNVL
jgi:hypothetical protein